MTQQLTRKAPRLSPAWVVGSHIFIVAVFGAAAVHAQVPAAVPAAFSPAGPAATASAAPSVDVEGTQPDAVIAAQVRRFGRYERKISRKAAPVPVPLRVGPGSTSAESVRGPSLLRRSGAVAGSSGSL